MLRWTDIAALVVLEGIACACVYASGASDQQTIDSQRLGQCEASLAVAQGDATHYEAVAQTQRHGAEAAMAYGGRTRR